MEAKQAHSFCVSRQSQHWRLNRNNYWTIRVLENQKHSQLLQILDTIGEVSEELNDEWFIYEAMNKGHSLSEIENWSMDEYRKWKSFCEVKRWQEEVAYLFYQKQNRK